MADIESQGQGDGKTERPSYTRLCTYKILPISLVICSTSIFSAAIVCTSLDKPIPPNAVIVISTIAGSLLLLILAGYLKIYHDRNGMDKVHPRAEEALKAFRDGFDPGHHLRQQDRQSQRPLPAEQHQHYAGNRHPPASNPQPRPVPPARHPGPSHNPDQSRQWTESYAPETVGRDYHFPATVPRDAFRYPQPSQQPRRHPPSAQVSPLNPAQKRQWQNDQGAHLARVPDVAAQLQAVLSDTIFASPLKTFTKPTVSLCHHEKDPDHHHRLFDPQQPHIITPTQSRKSSASTSTTDASSSTSPNTPSSSRSSRVLLSTPPRPPPPSPATESLSFPQFPVQCHTEQNILRNTKGLLVEHRAKCHTKHDSTRFVYCRPLRSAQDRKINDPER
ncbi:hypothetical protein PG996_014197 [Apiospora saccharicola]|uniref:Uncharacterized protein n=1 Tax=Apiospora saccharicola TaxID=335842 RepID=A0ABR1THM9_9PEZI